MEKAYVEVQIPNLFCPDCNCKDIIVEKALMDYFNLDSQSIF